MQKIDKSVILSTQYKLWVEGINGDHPNYYSSHRFVKDIKMSLLSCQKGLCAYTEEQLCDESLLVNECWEDGKYIQALDNQNLVNGQLEHFDCTLKERQAYLWDNLFMVNSDINTCVKRTRLVKSILKPDTSDYNPFVYLQFDDKINRFIPNNNLLEDEKQNVAEMIETLGINSNAFKRAKQIKNLKEDFEFGEDLEEPYEYITSWKMTLKNLQNT